MKNDKMVRFLKNIMVLIAVLPLLGSCIREDEVANSPQGNFEALWKIIDEQYCFLEYKTDRLGCHTRRIQQADYRQHEQRRPV